MSHRVGVAPMRDDATLHACITVKETLPVVVDDPFAHRLLARALFGQTPSPSPLASTPVKRPTPVRWRENCTFLYADAARIVPEGFYTDAEWEAMVDVETQRWAAQCEATRRASTPHKCR